jgi:hypothetical protein
MLDILAKFKISQKFWAPYSKFQNVLPQMFRKQPIDYQLQNFSKGQQIQGKSNHSQKIGPFWEEIKRWFSILCQA